jgi:NADPH:quinone reductase
MRAIAFTRPLPIEAPDSLVELDLPRPEPGSDGAGKPRVLGWDAAGVVVDKGSAVSGFAVGDEVYYAGELERPGSNAEYQAVDERLVGRKPKSIGFAEAAALPLTSITAWELLFDRFGVRVAINDGSQHANAFLGPNLRSHTQRLATSATWAFPGHVESRRYVWVESRLDLSGQNNRIVVPKL